MRASTEVGASSGMHLVELQSGAYRATLAPSAGGRIGSLSWSDASRSVDLLQAWDGSAFSEHVWPKAGAFPMLPFANRLPAAGFRFGNRLVRPEPGPSGLVQHGVAHRRPWRLLNVSAERACMQLEMDSTPDWPWAWSAEMNVSLGNTGMSVVMRVRNTSTEPMPLSMGWHPYHPTHSSIRSRDLTFDAIARHDLDAEARASLNTSAPVFDMAPGETAAFSGWNGQSSLRVRGEGAIEVACTGSPHLVLHRPMNGGYVCIEPVTVLPGRLGEEGSGLLEPNHTQQVHWSCGFRSEA